MQGLGARALEAVMARTNIGNLLIEQGRIDDMQLKSAVAYQRRWGGRIGQAMVTLGFLSEQVLMSTLSLQLGANYIEIGDRLVPPGILKMLPQKLMKERRVLP